MTQANNHWANFRDHHDRSTYFEKLSEVEECREKFKYVSRRKALGVRSCNHALLGEVVARHDLSESSCQLVG
jgi:hypothetical protein